MANNVVTAAGLGLALLGYSGRYIFKRVPSIAQLSDNVMKAVEVALNSGKYYKGGFESRMTKREASLILGVNQTANTGMVKESYKRLITVNHPDRGGSPYIATKINEAKDYLAKGLRSP